ncbi:MAG: serine/threonine protein kinase [Marmoricola sp.]|nr:serine/threonine protein kinase [Marmoricola sp.]
MDEAGRTVGRYQMVGEIGRGGMATVHVARQLDLDRQVALKELRALGTIDPTFARRFLREARLAGALSHQNIVTVYEYFEHEGVPYIAMEYLARGSLRPYIGQLTLPQIGGVLEGLLAGLSHAERSGVVHRDIKPENLLVTVEGGIKIADFGIAKATHALEQSSELTAIGTTVGTPKYIAPEQAMSRALGPWTDLYSVGITAFELLVGRTPFGDTADAMGIVLRQINEPAPRVSDLVPHVHPLLSDWVGWLVSKAPADRPQSASQAWDALEDGLLGMLGPRWRREAPLLAPAAHSASMSTPSPVPRGTHPGAGVMGGFGQAAPPPAAVRPMRSSSMPRTRPETDYRLAATQPPRRLAAAVPPVATAKRWPRRGTKLRLAAAGLVLVSLGSMAIGAHQGGGISPTGDAANQTLPDSSPSASDSALPQTSTAPDPDSSLTDKAAGASQLATTYDQTAARISTETNGVSSSTATALISALRQTASAYRAAASSAAKSDLAGYAQALTAAATGRQEVSRLLTDYTNGSDAATSPAPAPAPAPSPVPTPTPTPTPAPKTAPTCAGDSVSDDPSDDDCGGA